MRNSGTLPGRKDPYSIQGALPKPGTRSMAECWVCGSFHQNPALFGGIQGGDVYVQDLVESRDGGCPGCGLILDAIGEVHPRWRDFVEAGEVCLTTGAPPAKTLQVNGHASRVGRTFSFEIFGLQGAPNPFGTLPSREHILPDLRDVKECGSKISGWLKRCADSASHSARCGGGDATFTPRRLIEVGSATDKPNVVRLVEPEAHPEQVQWPIRYVALSYCWGSDLSGIVTTRKENLDQHRRGIPVSSLPKTLQDTIAICRAIAGVRYVWIDAICIVQNDLHDWETESVRMRDIYFNSYLTLAVQSARSCKDGFLGQQIFGRPTWQLKFHTSAAADGASSSTRNTKTAAAVPMLLRQKLGLEDGSDGGLVPFPEDDVTFTTPLLERGWTFQEAIMPRRIVHFTGRELVWECGTSHWCECGHTRYPERYGMPGPAHELLVKTNSERQGGGQKGAVVDPGVEWTSVLNAYGKRNFTKTSDRLIALSGVAKIMAERFVKASNDPRDSLASIYLAGIYRTCIPRHLLWEVDWKLSWGKVEENNSSTPQPAAGGASPPAKKPYRAPSWSWASVEHAARYSFGDWEEASHVRLVGAGCRPRVPGGDPTGNVASGELELRGLVVPVTLLTTAAAAPGGRAPPLQMPVNPLTGRAPMVRASLWGGAQTLVRAPDGRHKEEISVDARAETDADSSPPCPCWGADAWCGACRRGGGTGARLAEAEFCCIKMATCWQQPSPGRLNVRGLFLALRRSGGVPGAWERVGVGALAPAGQEEPASRRRPPRGGGGGGGNAVSGGPGGREGQAGMSEAEIRQVRDRFEREEWGLFRGAETMTLRLV